MKRTLKVRRKAVGRPIVYKGELKRHIIVLIKRHGLSGTKDILNARQTTKKGQQRNLEIIPRPLGICFYTLQRLARSEGITFKQGRPKKVA